MGQGNIVRYIHLKEIPDQYSMGIFIFPPHAKIPLHDHPGMCVLSRILYGDIVRLSLDLPRDSEDNFTKVDYDDQRSHWSTWSSDFPPFVTSNDQKISASQKHHRSMAGIPGAKRAFQNKMDVLRAPEVTCLYPFEGNLHEFVAGPQGAAVLDVLLPPYVADSERDCNFYDIVHDEPNQGNGTAPNLYDQHHLSLSSESNRNFDCESGSRGIGCWIVPTGQPENFHCISGRYRGLGT
jgi:plant cysteine oxidase